MDDQKLWELISSMTLKEKAALCSGSDAWHTKGNAKRGIPVLRMADGPHGLRVVDMKHRRQNGGPSRRATCFPPAVTLACAWSEELAGQVGAALAEECLAEGVGLVLGPGVNIKRSPLGGRNFEYFSEDPLLAGELAAGFIRGVQGRGVGTSLKHYAVNSQETHRMSINVAVDDRALFDIYLKAFQIAVRRARPDTIMASYNRLNGTFATENRRLLTEILRLHFGFTGVVVSDWGAVNDRAAALAAGLDLEMPGSGGMNDWAIERAVESGFLTEQALDTACLNLLRLIFRRSRAGKAAPAYDAAAHHRLAADVLCKSAVLLKNDGILPLGKNTGRVAIIGELAEKPRYQGGGSSVINPTRVTSFLAAMKAAGQPFVYAPGYRGDATNPLLLDTAVQAAKQAERVVLFLGLPDNYECESFDREHLSLPPDQLRLIDAVAAANPNVVAVLCCGGPVEAPWLGKVRALLCLHLGGQALGDAAVRLLYGQANPGGKLAESWPLALADSPAHHSFPMGPHEVRYRESIYVGYRYYDTAKKDVLFPFGYGLSYTQYRYSGLVVEDEHLAPDQPLKLRFRVKNVGGVAGEEIAQVYLARQGSAVFQPEKELLAFRRVALAAGEEKELRFEVPYTALAFYDAASHGPVVEQGRYQLLAGPSSRELPLQAAVAVDGVTLAPAPVSAADGPYAKPVDNSFPEENFLALCGRLPLSNEPPRKGSYDHTTPLSLMRDSATGRLIAGVTRLVSRQAVIFSADKDTNKKAACKIADELPYKNLSSNSMGIISPRVADALLGVCNGQGGWGKVLGAAVAKKPWKTK